MKRILLIDDEEVITFGFKKVLAGPGVEVDCARSMGEARVFIQTMQYDAAVVDLRLSYSSEMEGFDCVRLLQSGDHECRIIILTAYGDPALKERAGALGVDLFLEKPVKPQAIKDVLKKFGIYET